MLGAGGLCLCSALCRLLEPADVFRQGASSIESDLQVLMRVRGITDPSLIKPEFDDIVEVWLFSMRPLRVIAVFLAILRIGML